MVEVDVSVEDFCDELDYNTALHTVYDIDETCMASWEFTIDVFKHFLDLMIGYYKDEEDEVSLYEKLKSVKQEMENA
jgi:aspartate/tyrosine/aromatic aminotransferase